MPNNNQCPFCDKLVSLPSHLPECSEAPRDVDVRYKNKDKPTPGFE